MTLNRMFPVALLLLATLSGRVVAQDGEREHVTGEFRGAMQAEIPAWFKSSFLDLREDIAAATAAKKRLLLYIGQDGCPYCAALMQVNFGRQDIATFTRANFDAVAINMWGDREVTDAGGGTATEKEFAAQLKVQYTPTLLFFDESARVVLRLNGYRPPEDFLRALEYVAGRHESRQSFSEFLVANPPSSGATGKLHAEPGFLKPPLKLAARAARKPLVVFFEQKVCSGCDDLHRIVLRDADSALLLAKFDAVQIDIASRTRLISPAGKVTNAHDWANDLGITYTPSAVLFGPDGKEAMRVEGMLKTFHLQSVLDYVASGTYRTEPNFQRFIEARAERIRATGKDVDIWR